MRAPLSFILQDFQRAFVTSSRRPNFLNQKLTHAAFLSPLLILKKSQAFHATTPTQLNKNPYEVLGISKSSSAADVKKAYFQLAKKYHPDAFQSASEKEKQQAKEKFVEIQEAYELLSDENKRKMYDTYGHAGGQSTGFGGDDGQWTNVDPRTAEEIFKSFFGGGMGGRSAGFGGFGGFPGFNDFTSDDVFGRGRGTNRSRRDYEAVMNGDVTAKLSISFMDAIQGIKRMVGYSTWVKCKTCSGTGLKPGSSPTTCGSCHGTGQQSISKGGFQLFMTCQTCGGAGSRISASDICGTCKGEGKSKEFKETVIDIPAGIDHGERLRFTGLGHSGEQGKPGDLYVIVDVGKPGPLESMFTRKGSDLYVDVPVSFYQAVIGDTIPIPTLDDQPASIKIPAGTQPNQRLTIKGRGVQKFLQRKGIKGDLFVNLKVLVPKGDSMTAEQKAALERFWELTSSSKKSAKEEKDNNNEPKKKGNDNIFTKTINKLKETLCDDKEETKEPKK